MVEVSFPVKRLLIVGILFIWINTLRADPPLPSITGDGTLNTVINQEGSDYTIKGGTAIETNLFHSFDRFNVNTGETATFEGPEIINNVIGRVTGGSISSIDGLIRSTITGADLFLINPAGMMFGSNAVLEVDGSFHISSADYLVLGAGGRFDATDPGSSALTAAPPAAFGFLGAGAGDITFGGSMLEVPAGKTLSVVAGDITIADASLYAPGGQINLASVNSAGEVGLGEGGAVTEGISKLGRLTISESKHVFNRPFSANFFPIANIDVSGDSAGKIFIRAGQFTSDNGYVFSDTHGAGTGSQVDIVVREELHFDNEARVTADTGFGGGPGGEISIKAGRVVFEHGSQISVASFGAGDAGQVDIQADEIVISGKSSTEPRLMGDQPAAVISEIFNISTGNGGVITMSADAVTVDEQGLVTASTQGDGNGGVIIVDVDELTVAGGAAILTDTSGPGNGGHITVNATGLVKVIGGVVQEGPGDTFVESRIGSNVFGSGDGGTITINSATLQVEDQAVIQASLEDNPDSGPSPGVGTQAGKIDVHTRMLRLTGGGQISSLNLTGGTGGNLTVSATESTLVSGAADDGLQTSGLFAVTAGDGPGGTIWLTTEALYMDGDSSINASSIGRGDAGAIDIVVDDIELHGGARVSSSTSGAGDGGILDVTAIGRISASGKGSDGFGSGFYSIVQVVDQPEDATGDGGNINLNGRQLLLSDGATVNAKSEGLGNAGTINITTGVDVRLLNGATISTESLNSGGGKINIDTAELLFLLNSGITSSVADGSGNGGDISIDPVFVILINSQIIANAFAGNGGNISIVTDYFFSGENSIVEASSQLGIDGTVDIFTPDTDVSASLVGLPAAFQDATRLLRQRCAARTGISASSLVVVGRGGVPPAPDELLSGTLMLEEPWLFENVTSAVSSTADVTTSMPADDKGEPFLLLGCAK